MLLNGRAGRDHRRPSRRVGVRTLALWVCLVAAFASPAVAQVAAHSPEAPIWGIYATGDGYVVDSPAMFERAEYEGISVECFKTLTIAVMPEALVAPDSPATYWLARNIAAGLVETKATGLTWWQAQQELGVLSPYRNPDIDCVSEAGAASWLLGSWTYNIVAPGHEFTDTHEFLPSGRMNPDGTWSLVGSELVVSWPNGWRNVYDVTRGSDRRTGVSFGPEGQRRASVLER